MDLTSFLASLSDSGIDIVQPFDARWYDALIEQEGLTKQLKPLPKMGSRDGALGFLLGNSRALWPAFLKWLSDQPDAEAIADPLDKYIASVIQPAVRLLTGKEMRHELIWPWESGDRLVSMQRVAVCSGLCYHDGETQLAIHPKFGAWIAFRAVLILDAAPSVCGLPSKAPEPVPCLMTSDEKEAARAAMAAALRASDEANLCTQLHGANGMKTDVRLAWAALRDCVRVGRQYRYCALPKNAAAIAWRAQSAGVVERRSVIVVGAAAR